MPPRDVMPDTNVLPPPRLAETGWADRVSPGRIRRLYHDESQGFLDPDVVLDVGWDLWARARDVARVSVAVHTGIVQCAQCGGAAQRTRSQGSQGAAPASPVHCTRCNHAASWRDLGDALRRRPRCLDCGAPLEWDYGEGGVACRKCATGLAFRDWRQRLRGRVWLPCPGCGQKVRKPIGVERRSARAARANPPPGETVTCPACNQAHPWRDVRGHWRREAKCACGGKLTDRGGELRCDSCGRATDRGRLTRRLSRRRTGPCPSCGKTIRRDADAVVCQRCGASKPWNAYRRAWQGQHLLTGAGVDACKEFVERWPQCRTPKAQVLLIDSLVHELHDGPLAPLFILGSKQSVAVLLDELAGRRPGAR